MSFPVGRLLHVPGRKASEIALPFANVSP